MAGLVVRNFPPDLNQWLAATAAAARVSKERAVIALLEMARVRGDVLVVGTGPKAGEQ